MIIKGLSSFKGANRRFEMRGHYKGAVVIDDYAHHPTEMRATFSAAQRVDHKRLIVVFQPHTYTRTRDFFQDFVEVLSVPDIVVLAPVYSAREKDVYGIHSTDIRDELKKKGKNVYAFDTFDEIKKFLSETLMNGDLLITMGAGDIVKIADDISS
jgi:UDP-N-acetylmuramate--alanine ligase